MLTEASVAALVSTGIVCLVPNIFLFVFPNYGTGEGSGSRVLSLGQSIAAGGLLGDVFLHTLPHALQDATEPENVGLWTLLGFFIFFLADIIIRSMGHDHDHHLHEHPRDDKQSDSTQTESSLVSQKKGFFSITSSAVVLNLIADAMHNFSDGLSIGASFAMQKPREGGSFLSLVTSKGGVATVSILLHELPHELGDFCTLVKAGYSRRDAVLAQFGTAVAAMVGSMVGIAMADTFGDNLLFVTGGGFIYLAASIILPELLQEHASLYFRLAQICAFSMGVASLYAVALLEEHDHSDHHHDHVGHHHEHHTHEHEDSSHLHNSYAHHSHHHESDGPHEL